MNFTIPAWLDELFSGVGNIMGAIAEEAPLFLDFVIALSYVSGIAIFLWAFVLAAKIGANNDPRGRGPMAILIVVSAAIMMINLPDTIATTMRTGGMDASYEMQSVLCKDGSVSQCKASAGGTAPESQVQQWADVVFALTSFIGPFVVWHSLLRLKRIGDGTGGQQDTPAACLIQGLAGALIANSAAVLGFM